MNKENDFDLQDFLPYLLNRAAEETSLDFQRRYKDRYGLLRTDWRVLFHLGRYGQMTASEIGEKARIHKTKISRAVRNLQERRYLKRTNDEMDRRFEHLELTRAGQQVYADLSEEAKKHDLRTTAEFSAAEVDILRRCLKQLAGIAGEHGENLKK